MMPRIWLLPSASLHDRDSLPNRPGIYYAIAAGKIFYIGRAKNLRSRWRDDHHKLAKLQAIDRQSRVTLAYWVRPLWRLNHDEAVEILRFKPLLNDRNESPVWWIGAIDWLSDSLKIGSVLLLGYAAYCLLN